MAMPFDVRNARDLEGVVPGAIVSFTLVIGKESSHAEGLRIVRYESVEKDPITARRLRLLQNLTGGGATVPSPVAVGQNAAIFSYVFRPKR